MKLWKKEKSMKKIQKLFIILIPEIYIIKILAYFPLVTFLWGYIDFFNWVFYFYILLFHSLKLYLGHFPRSFISLKEMWYEVSGKNGREIYAHKTLLAISQYSLWVTSSMRRQINKHKNQPANISMKTKIGGDFSYIKNICCISKYL